MIPFPQRVEAVTKRLVSEYGVAGPEALPVSPIGFALSEGEAESSHIHRRHLDALFDIHERQEQVGRIVGRVRPAIDASAAARTRATRLIMGCMIHRAGGRHGDQRRRQRESRRAG